MVNIATTPITAPVTELERLKRLKIKSPDLAKICAENIIQLLVEVKP